MLGVRADAPSRAAVPTNPFGAGRPCRKPPLISPRPHTGAPSPCRADFPAPTVISRDCLILFASRRDCADRPALDQRVLLTRKGFAQRVCDEELQLRRTFGRLPSAALVKACSSAIRRKLGHREGDRTASRSRSACHRGLNGRRGTAPAPPPPPPGRLLHRNPQMRRITPSRNVPVPTAGSASVTSLAASPAGRENSGPLSVFVDQPRHRVDHFRRRVVGAGQLAQIVVVDGEKKSS